MNVGMEGVKQEIELITACCASTFMWNMVEASTDSHRNSTKEFRRLGKTGVPQVSEYQKVNTARTAEVTTPKIKTARIAGDDQ